MKKFIQFNDGIIGGDDMRDFLAIFPELENRFTQRKSYDEYYFKSFQDYEEDKIDTITLEQLNQLSKEFRIQLDRDNLTILL
jgi:hypothetical protein